MSVDKPVTFSVTQGSVVGPFYSITMLDHFQTVLSMMEYLLMGLQMTILFIIPIKQEILVQRPIPLGPCRTPSAV